MEWPEPPWFDLLKRQSLLFLLDRGVLHPDRLLNERLSLHEDDILAPLDRPRRGVAGGGGGGGGGAPLSEDVPWFDLFRVSCDMRRFDGSLEMRRGGRLLVVLCREVACPFLKESFKSNSPSSSKHISKENEFSPNSSAVTDPEQKESFIELADSVSPMDLLRLAFLDSGGVISSSANSVS
jgi:hypothetical protein